MGQKSEIIYARISEELKGRLNEEVTERGEAEAVIIREALKQYFERLDKSKSTQRYPEPPDKLNETAGNPVTPQDIAAAKLAHLAISEVQGAQPKPPPSNPSDEAEAGRMRRKVSGIIRRDSAAGRSVRREKRGK